MAHNGIAPFPSLHGHSCGHVLYDEAMMRARMHRHAPCTRSQVAWDLALGSPSNLPTAQ